MTSFQKLRISVHGESGPQQYFESEQDNPVTVEMDPFEDEQNDNR